MLVCLQASSGESRIPTVGSSKDKRRSLLPGPKTLSKLPDPVDGTENNGSIKPESGHTFRQGDKVIIAGIKTGRLRYIGPAHFTEGEWCGIELDEPDGKHDGIVEGKRYFTCIPNHGIFAPLQKVEPYHHSQNGVSDSEKAEIKRDASPANVGSHLKQPKISGLVQPQTHTSSSQLPEKSTISPEPKGPGKFLSKLTKPKVIPRPRSINSIGLSSSSDTDQDSSPIKGKELHVKKPSKLPINGKPGKKGSIKESKSQLSQSNIQNKYRPLKKQTKGCSHKKKTSKGLNDTFTYKEKGEASNSLNDTYTFNEKGDDEYDGDLLNDEIKVTTPSRVDALTAFTLAYDLDATTSGSDSDCRKGLNLTFDLAKKKKEGSLLSPIPDLLTPPAYYNADEIYEEYGGEAMSEPEDNYDILVASSISHASSLGILADTQLCDNSLLTDELKAALRKQEAETKESTELMEKDLDQEISGISTPEIDMSSSTISGKDGSSSPELYLNKEDPLFNPLAGEQTSTPLKKLSDEDQDTEAGEKLATPASSKSGSSPEAEVGPEANPGTDLTYEIRNANEEEPMEIDADDEGEDDDKPRNANKTYRVTHRTAEVDSESCSSGASSNRSSGVYNQNVLDELEQYPRGMRTSVDLDDMDVTNVNASVELAKTAVQQYASLMRGAEKEKAQAEVDQAVRRARRMTPCSSAGSSMEKITSTESLCAKKEALNAKKEQDELIAQEERDQLLQDLQAGHSKHQQKSRPVSMISSGSADTGLGGELVTPTSVIASDSKKERPLSLISTSSIDTGRWHVPY